MNASGNPSLPKQVAVLGVEFVLWFLPVPAGLTGQAWHLFAVFAATILSVILNAFPLLTAAMLAVAAVVLTHTVEPAKCFAGFANSSVLLVVVALLVARSVVKSAGAARQPPRGERFREVGTRARLQHLPHRRRDRAGLPEQHGPRWGAVPDRALPGAKRRFQARRREDPPPGRLPHVLGDGEPRGLLGTLADGHVGQSDRGGSGRQIWSEDRFRLMAPRRVTPGPDGDPAAPRPVLYRLYPPGTGATPEALAAARQALRSMGRLSRDERIVALAFALMVAGWVLAKALRMDLTAVAFGGFGLLLATQVLTLDDLALEGGTLITFLWLAVLFALSSQLNELGFMGYVGGRLSSVLGGIPWPAAYVALIVLYVLMHFMFVSQSSQVLALFGVFLDVGIRSGVPVPLMGFSLLFASSYFSTITPQGGSQNVLFVGSGYLTQGELYRLGALTTAFCVLVFLVVGTPWLLFVAR